MSILNQQNFVYPTPEMRKPDTSIRNMNVYRLFSTTTGVVTPCLFMDLLPGDDFDMHCNCNVETFPMVGAPKGSWKASIDYFIEMWSNLYGFLDNNNRTSTQEIIEMPFHTYSFGMISDEDLPFRDYTINQCDWGSVYDYLGVPPGFFGKVVQSWTTSTSPVVEPIELNAHRLLTYLDVIRNYYVNPQENQTYYIGRLSTSSGDNRFDADYLYESVDLKVLDDLFKCLRYFPTGVNIGSVVFPSLFGDNAGANAQIFIRKYLSMYLGSLSGLFLRPYKMDLLRGIMNNSVGTYKSYVDVRETGEFDMHTLFERTKLQYLIDTLDIGSGRASDWIYARWHVKPFKHINRPIYCGSTSFILNQRDIIATASGQSGNESSANPNSQLGQQVGFAVGTLRNSRKINIRTTEYATLCVCFSLVPYVNYSQGFELETMKTKFADVYDPLFKQIGFQDVSRYELSSLPQINNLRSITLNDIPELQSCVPNTSVGKRIAWSEYMDVLGRTHGQFAAGGSLDYWAFNRVYTQEVNNDELPYYARIYGGFNTSTYVRPSDWNYLFADTSNRAENFRVEIGWNIKARRPISKRLMPHI